MEELLETIRTATTAEASDEARAAGAAACRTLLTILDTKEGEPLVTAPSVPASPLVTAVAALRGVPPDQLLDLAIARLRAVLPEGAPAPEVAPVKFHIIQLPPAGSRR
jgi:hypothetical protein